MNTQLLRTVAPVAFILASMTAAIVAAGIHGSVPGILPAVVAGALLSSYVMRWQIRTHRRYGTRQQQVDTEARGYTNSATSPTGNHGGEIP